MSTWTSVLNTQHKLAKGDARRRSDGSKLTMVRPSHSHGGRMMYPGRGEAGERESMVVRRPAPALSA